MERSSFRSLLKTPLREEGVWKTLLIDSAATTADLSKPAFMAPPAGSKPYHGFPLLDETEMDGWRYGAISDFLETDCEEGCTIGDGYAQAPDGTRAGVIWNVDAEPRFAVVEKPSGARWGVFHFTIPQPVVSLDDMKQAFWRIVPVLKDLHKRFHPQAVGGPTSRSKEG
jgi:hypothetical protein